MKPERAARAAGDVAQLADHYLSSASTEIAPDSPSSEAQEIRLRSGSVCSTSIQYALREKIGEGGMGVVYRAFDEKLRRDVALKILLRPDGDYLERFLREQEIMGCLDHPNFVRILSSGFLSLGGQSLPFYTMPLIRGRNLERLIVRRSLRDAEGESLREEYPLSVLLVMLGQLCFALQSAHDKRIVHRDLKPSNILVGPYADVYVTDLGLAKFLGTKSKESARFQIHVMEQLARAAKQDITHGAILGTPFYMAPEQGLSPGDVDHRVDVFGLGGILYFILTGRRPQYADPAVDRPRMETRRQEILRALTPLDDLGQGVAAIRSLPRAELFPEVRRLADELSEIDGILAGSEYHRFRYAMRECTIVSPRQVLAASGAPDLDPELDQLCMKALAKRAEDRYPSCRAFWQAIQQYLPNVES